MSQTTTSITWKTLELLNRIRDYSEKVGISEKCTPENLGRAAAYLVDIKDDLAIMEDDSNIGKLGLAISLRRWIEYFIILQTTENKEL